MSVSRIAVDPEKTATNCTDFFALAVVGHHKQIDTSCVPEVTQCHDRSLQQVVTWAKGVPAEYDMTWTLAENNQAQQWFVETAKDHGLTVDPTTSTGKKEDRLLSMFTRFENGNVKLVEQAGMEDSWTAFESEVAQFPSGHDDQLDAAEIALRGLDESDGGSYGLFSGTS